jgi:UDP-N-acetylmuramate--alanine ligase
MHSGDLSSPAARDQTALNVLKGSPGTVHMLGIGGVGMAGVALMLSRLGWRVSGCDAYSGPLLPWLAQEGISCTLGHHPSHLIPRPDFIVRSPAVHWNQPELLDARRLGVPVIDRGRLLPELLAPYQSIAVAGTHGKTTTASMIAWCLQRAGHKTSFCIGGVCPGLGAVAHAEKDGWMVVEADESDGTLRHYRPNYAVVTSMDMDHVDYFQHEKMLMETYGTFVDSADLAVYPAADHQASHLMEHHPNRCSFGINSDSDMAAFHPELQADRSTFLLRQKGHDLATIQLGVPGRHNILNALAASAVVLKAGVTLASIQSSLTSFRLPQRRYEIIAEGKGRTVISDYAHHPAEIAALLAQARLRGARRLVAVFQPHRYSRTKAFIGEFADVLGTVDQLILVPVYAASEPYIEGGTSDNLLQVMSDRKMEHVELSASVADAWEKLKKIWQPDDLILIIGAGDVELVAKWAGEELSSQ